MADVLDRVCNLLNHKRAEVSWVCRPVYRYVCAETGQPSDNGFSTRADAERYYKGKARRVLRIQRMARIVVVYPADGAGRLRVAVSDWTQDGDPIHHVGSASGYGYDKLTAALAGAQIGGIEIGDHSDYKGRPTLKDLARSKGWEIIGNL